jgi:L-amino acid N-acyltransferase YncA
VIHAERPSLQIRMATAADAGAVRAIYAPIVEGSVISFEVAVPSEAEIASRIVDRQPQFPWLIAERDGAVLGYAYAGRFAARAAYEWSAEVSAYVAEPARGSGVGRALYCALFGVLDAQGHHRAMAGITLPNAASVGLHEAMGFSLVGVFREAGWKFGAWHDVGWWQRALRAHDGPPGPPVPLDALPADVVDAALRSGAETVR